jgi:cis-L-3-hydroxyproline dehydratase
VRLTDQEKSMLDGSEGPVAAEAIDKIIQFGEAFNAERLVDIVFCHFSTASAIYPGLVEDVMDYVKKGGRVRVPCTCATGCTDIERPEITGIPRPLAEKQALIEGAYRAMGIMETFTCTPQQLGFIPPFGSYMVSTESSAIIYYSSVIGARLNRGGFFTTRYAAMSGKYPPMGYLLDENRQGTHHFKVRVPSSRLQSTDAWAALGVAIGTIVGSDVPVIEGVRPDRQDWLISLGAALATSGSVTLYHVPGITPEARTVEEAFQGKIPKDHYEITEKDLDAVYERMTTASKGSTVDFVALGCPHCSLEHLRVIADLLRGKRIASGVRFWVCTNRMTRLQAEYSGYVRTIEDSGAVVVVDTCPVESHMRQSSCREWGLEVPNVKVMVADSGKMTRYVGDLIGCKTVLTTKEKCIDAAVKGKWES